MPIEDDAAGLGDNSFRPRSRQSRVARTQKKVFRGDVDGRVGAASPVPPRSNPEIPLGMAIFVGPDDPGLDSGYDLWFDTDEPVPGT